MVSKVSIILLLIVAGFLGINATYLDSRSDIPGDCDVPNTAIGSVEHLVYKAYYNWQFVWIPAGEADFKIKDFGNTYEVTVYGKTYPSYDGLFRVRDYFRSVIDKKSMIPKSFVRIVEEGNYRKFDSIEFNQHKMSAISYNGRTRATAKRKYITIHECTHDLLSVLYFMRNINVNAYKIGEAIPTKLLFDETTYPVKVRLADRTKNHHIKDVGTFNTLKVIPDLITGTVFKEGNKMEIWVTDDKNKLPLLIESPLSVGSAKAILKSYSGLKNKLESRIK